MSGDYDKLADRLDAITEELDDLMFDQLREASAARVGRPADDKRLTQARRAIEKSSRLLRGHMRKREKHKVRFLRDGFRVEGFTDERGQSREMREDRSDGLARGSFRSDRGHRHPRVVQKDPHELSARVPA